VVFDFQLPIYFESRELLFEGCTRELKRYEILGVGEIKRGLEK
jgi:hypothetical protein